MHFKLIIALVEDDKTNAVMDAARQGGATGATINFDAIDGRSSRSPALTTGNSILFLGT